MKYFLITAMMMPAAAFAGGAMSTPWNQFAMKMEAQLPKGKNAVYSPLSIWIALAMVEHGAEKATKRELHDALAVGTMTPEKIGETLREVGESKDYEIGIANGLWPAADLPYRKEYVSDVKKYFGADFEPLDYKKDPEAARVKINRWVEQKTRDKIKEIVAKGLIRADMKFVLANAVYFKADWADQFQKEFTKERDFHVTASKSIKVPMMHKTDYFGYYADERIQALKMYYKGMEMSFVAVLPKAGVPLAEAGPVQAERIFGQMPGKRVIVGMPRFKIEAELGDMVKKMENLGVKRVFSPATAELGPIAAPAEGPLFVSEILHKAMIDVNEAGTEAAAATVVMMRAGGMPPKDEPPKFIADRPFRFYVMHEKTKSILFAGQFLTPARK